MIATDIGLAAAFWGGFSSFFSIWQLCLMQITPFFLAFTTGLYFLEEQGAIRRTVLSIVGFVLGFTVIFSMMGVQSLLVARYIHYHIDEIRAAAAVYLISLAVIMILYCNGNSYVRDIRLFKYLLPVGICLGASFAVAYSPCITPRMSEIMNFSSRLGNEFRGLWLFIFYSIGLTLAFAISGILLSIAIDKVVKISLIRSNLVYISSVFLVVMASLMISGLMLPYKSVLVGIVLD